MPADAENPAKHHPILDEQVPNYIMPDIVRCGGISKTPRTFAEKNSNI